MHFLMPYIFRSRKEFAYWFNTPLNSMVEGNRSINANLISRLHSIMRPFVLRRLKADVAKQLPPKIEHVVMCKLSKRQLFLYEEFMARTSTKAHLQGGNYMGMMNILMQLRKVCNHPDLFEPRPIVSPFSSASIEFRPGNIVVSAMEVDKLACLSQGYLDLWNLNLDLSLRQRLQETTLTEELFCISFRDIALDIPSTLFHSKFQTYVSYQKDAYQAKLQDSRKLTLRINSTRCKREYLSVNWRLIRALQAPTFTDMVAASRYDSRIRKDLPLIWYSLIKSVDDRVEQMMHVIESFVFVLPKVMSSGPILITSNAFTDLVPRHSARRQLQTAVEKVLAPFYPSQIRQRLFFPDRKLVQFDSGKLQTLATLLRDLKAGGHKCLIFTQMSKMLDILEIFLNLHGHSYVRLDGTTAIDKRQKLMDRFNNDSKLFCFILSTRSGGLGINLVGADTVIFYDR